MKTKTLAKILSAALVICLMLALASCDLFGGSLKLESFTVDRTSVKTVYYIGEEIDFSGIKATVKYSDASLNTEYTAKDLTVTYPEDITATEGTKTVTVSFMDPHLNVQQSTTVQITVKEDPNAIKHDRYVVDSSAMKKDYLVGETVDFTGIKIIEKFTNGGADVEMTDLSSVVYEYDANTITSEHAVKTIVVKYNGENAGTITINVTDPSLDLVPVTGIQVTGTYKSTYEKGETIDFTGLTVTVTYDGQPAEVIALSNLTIKGATTASVGICIVTVEFTDPVNDVPLSKSFEISVIEARVKVTAFAQNLEINSFNSSNSNAGKDGAGYFKNGNAIYVIGDDNAFKFLPEITVGDNDEELIKFHSVVDVYVDNGEGYVLLTKTAINNTEYVYKLGEETIVTVDTYNQEYQFAKPVNKVKISVKPSTTYYKNVENFNAVELEAKVIDAYNVYEAWELALFNSGAGYLNLWADFETEKGIAALNVNGLVLHNDIELKATDVPDGFFYTSERDVVCTKGSETKTIPAGTKFVKDDYNIYYRSGTAPFAFEGNFFTIDIREFPLVASPAVFDNPDWHYGSDYSNAALFKTETPCDNYFVAAPELDARLYLTINNISFIGNAARNEWVDSNGKLVSGGGLILIKNSIYAHTNINNCIANSFFITYFTERNGTLNVTNSKAYDSFQNAVFVWAASTLNMSDCVINGTGGPVVLTQSIFEREYNAYQNPHTNIERTEIDCKLTGQELWFQATNATEIVGTIHALFGGLEQGIQMADPTFKGNIVKDGNMNFKGILMPLGSGADSLTDAMIQGTLLFDGQGAERWYAGDEMNPNWVAILQHPAFAQAAPFITAFGPDGADYTIYFDGNTFRDLNGNVLGTAPEHQNYIVAFSTSQNVVLHQGGLTAVFEYYH